MSKISRKQYADLFGPTVGDKIRLGDTDLYVEIELARSNCYYGAWALENDAPELGLAACGARASASDAFELASREMIQLHGGVGYTWEFDCHLFYRRAKWLAAVLDGADRWRDRLVERLTMERTVRNEK